MKRRSWTPRPSASNSKMPSRAAQVLKTMYSAHGGKLSIVRVLAGEFGEGTIVQGARSEERAASAFSMLGQEARKRGVAKAGDTLALGRLEKVLSGETLSADKGGGTQVKPPRPPEPVYGVAISIKDRKDEVKLTGALAKLMEEDPSLRLEHSKDTHQMVLWGQGEMHLRVSLERLKRKYGVDAESQRRHVPLQGDHQEGRGDPRPAQEAVGRAWPVRRRGARHQAAAARHRLAVCRDDHGRRGAEAVHSLGGDRRDGLPQPRAARLSRGRRVGDADGGLLPFGGFLRHGLPAGRPHRHERGHAEVQSGAARADHGGRDRHPDGRDRARQRHDPAAARADPGLRRPRRLARLGRGAGAHAGVGDVRPDRRAALGDGRRRHLHRQVPSPGGADRPAGRDNVLAAHKQAAE